MTGVELGLGIVSVAAAIDVAIKSVLNALLIVYHTQPYLRVSPTDLDV